MQVGFDTSHTGEAIAKERKKSKFEECLIRNSDAIYDRNKLDESLGELNAEIQGQLNDWSQSRQTLPLYNIQYENKNNWKLGILPGLRENWFNNWAKKEALEIVKTYIEENFKAQIQEINIEYDFINIEWKMGEVRTLEYDYSYLKDSLEKINGAKKERLKFGPLFNAYEFKYNKCKWDIKSIINKDSSENYICDFGNRDKISVENICQNLEHDFKDRIKWIEIKNDGIHIGMNPNFKEDSKDILTDLDFLQYMDRMDFAIHNGATLKEKLGLLEGVINQRIQTYSNTPVDVPMRNVPKKIFPMFNVSFIDKDHWNIKVLSGTEEDFCFKKLCEVEALEIVKTYLEMRYSAKMEKLEIQNDEICIKWKEAVVADQVHEEYLPNVDAIQAFVKLKETYEVFNKAKEEFRLQAEKFCKDEIKKIKFDNNQIVNLKWKEFSVHPEMEKLNQPTIANAVLSIVNAIEKSHIFNSEYEKMSAGPFFESIYTCNLKEGDIQTKSEKIGLDCKERMFIFEITSGESKDMRSIEYYLKNYFKDRIEVIEIENSAIKIFWNS